MSRCFGAIFTALGRALPTNDHATRGGNLIFGRQTASVRTGMGLSISFGFQKAVELTSTVRDYYIMFLRTPLSLSSVFELIETPSFWNRYMDCLLRGALMPTDIVIHKVELVSYRY